MNKIELPSIYTNQNIQIRPLVRTIGITSQIGTNQFMTPNTPATFSHKQLDTSIKQVIDDVPNTYTEQQIQILKNQHVEHDFEVQRTFQKQILQLNTEIDQLRREIEYLRHQLVYEKSHFENLDKTIDQKHQQVINVNKINGTLRDKIKELEHKSDQFEEMYIQSDAHKKVLETRLNALRDSVEEDIVNKDYTMMPPTRWRPNQSQPPVCISKDNTVVCPMTSSNETGKYSEVFNFI